jgi:hypothetical protein
MIVGGPLFPVPRAVKAAVLGRAFALKPMGITITTMAIPARGAMNTDFPMLEPGKHPRADT